MYDYSIASSGRRSFDRDSAGIRRSESVRSRRSSRGQETAVSRGRGGASRSGAGRSSYQQPRHNRRRKRQRPDITQILLIVIAALVVILFAALIARGCASSQTAEESTGESQTAASQDASQEVLVDGININGLTQEEAREAILSQYAWNMKVSYDEKEADVSNLMEAKVDELLEEIYASELKPGESYTVNTDNMTEAAMAEAALIAGNWNMVAQNGGISGYNKETGKFEFETGSNGHVIDQEKLAADIVAAIQQKDYDAVIAAQIKEVSPEYSADDLREMYKTIGTYTTTTTSNSNRNENIRLACEALNGMIVNPGQEFSFNDATGARTEAKGYKPATAYLNGEVVQEPGGGVCQVSSTLYNAVIFSGLKSTERHAHSYEPSYVTPGEDAAVSYGGPDFKFVNNSDFPVAIRASFESGSRKLTLSIYGVQVLEDGVKIRMESERVGDLEPPAPVYEEDMTIPLDQEIEVKAATPGSRWTTYLVTYKNDEEVEREFFHNSSYRGKAATIKRNTSGTVITTEGSSESLAETLPGESAGVTESMPIGPAFDPSITESQNASGSGETAVEPGAGSEAGPGTQLPETEALAETQPQTEAPANPMVEQGPAGPGM